MAFVHKCLGLLREWEPEGAGDDFPFEPVAEHVIILHHTTKSEGEIAGNPAISADTSGLYRVRRFGRFGDPNRSNVAEVKPERVKGIAPPPSLRFEVELMQIDGTERSAPVLKGCADVPKKLQPVIAALRDLAETTGSDELSANDVRACVDRVAEDRTTRMRRRKELEDAGILEPLENGAFRVHLL